MQTRFDLSILSLVLASVLLVGCGDSPLGGNDDGPRGDVSFTYSGAISGSFSATGDLRVINGVPQPGSWAAGGWSEDVHLSVLSFRTRSGSRGDVLSLGIATATGPKTVPIAAFCGMGDLLNCAGVMLVTNVSYAEGSGGDHLCHLESGTVTLTSINNNRAQGTFSGTGTCFGSQLNPVGTFTITGGQFNVPMIGDWD